MSGLTTGSIAVKRLLLGKPYRSDRLNSRLLPKRIALPVFASDAISSVAYAPQEIFLVLSVAGISAYSFAPWVGLAVAAVMVVVVASYRQNVYAYPSGGGDYEVATTNMGPNAGVTVGAALLVDYVLTVAVSVTAAAENIGSAVPFVHEHKLLFCVLGIALVAAVNLRGIRESGVLMSVPTYAFILGVMVMLVWGFVQLFVLGRDLQASTAGYELVAEQQNDLTALAMVFLVARSFSSGCAALTGVEAISNGVPAFRKPKSRNAASTLLMLGAFSIVLLMGIVVLAQKLHAKYVIDPGTELSGLPENYQQKSVLAQLAESVFAGFPAGFYLIAVVTALILLLAANTAFNGFPVLGSVLAQDRYLPRQLHTRGDRLAFSNGIVFLALAALAFVVAFDAEVTQLIQLYIVGVFVSFTLSQTGMVRHWTRLLRTETDPDARRRMVRARVVNAVGMVMTGTVLVVVLATKFTSGAWIAVVVMVVLFVLMKLVHRHYRSVELELEEAAAEDDGVLPSRTHSIVLVSSMLIPTLRALRYARATRPDVLEAVTVNVDDRSTRTLVSRWEESDIDVPLKVIASPYRDVARPVINYVRRIRRDAPRDVVTVFIPEYVVGRWWEQILHNQSALRLKTRLLFEPGVMVTSVPWQLDSSNRAARRSDAQYIAPGDTRRGFGASSPGDDR